MDLIKRDTPRDIKFEIDINPYAAGSVLVKFGNTKVHVTAAVEESVAPWLRGKGQGWVTAEYSMLPMATHDRNRRERKGVSGRSQEIQRLIGRSLRAAVDMKLLGERTITLDCDVLVADGGTRTASISGAYVALSLAIRKLLDGGKIQRDPIVEQIGAISAGVNKDGEVIVDLNYQEDSSCETDMNVVMTRRGNLVEIQGTAEGLPFSRLQLDALVTACERGLEVVFSQQDKILK